MIEDWEIGQLFWNCLRQKGNYFVLDSVNLTGVDLIEANLTRADLTGAKVLTYNQLASAKSLSKTQGLETVLRAEELTRLKKSNEKR